MPIAAADPLLPLSLPSICQKKVTAAFDGGLISSNGGVLLLAGADRRLGLIDTLAAIIPDHRDPARSPTRWQTFLPLGSCSLALPRNGRNIGPVWSSA
jgi:hypothetical protein